jgi:hypothetical protein
MAFLDNYEPVANRIAKFWADHKDGRIHTEIKLINETEVIVMASVYTDREDMRPAAIDYAHETRGSSNINRASFLENCATSAIGRALATLGYSTKKGNDYLRPSREEMIKATQESRNYLIEAQEAASNKDLETLRTIYAAAVKATVDNDTLAAIKAYAEELKVK